MNGKKELLDDIFQCITKHKVIDMRIFNDLSNQKLDEITILLTKNEVTHLIGYLEQLNPEDSADHFHLMSEDYQKEITICLYIPKNTKNFNSRYQKLILEDE